MSLTSDAVTQHAEFLEHFKDMDVVFGDDDSRIQKDNAPANFATIKHMASNLLRSSKGKESMKSKRHMAAWDEGFLFKLIIG